MTNEAERLERWSGGEIGWRQIGVDAPPQPGIQRSPPELGLLKCMCLANTAEHPGTRRASNVPATGEQWHMNALLAGGTRGGSYDVPYLGLVLKGLLLGWGLLSCSCSADAAGGPAREHGEAGSSRCTTAEGRCCPPGWSHSRGTSGACMRCNA